MNGDASYEDELKTGAGESIHMNHLQDDQELREIWDELEAGVAEGPHPFHTAALATVGAHSGTPVAGEVRTVVLRYVDREGWRVDLHTDLRSPKVAELEANPAVSLLCYDAPGKRQLRLKGRAAIHNQDDLTAARWETVRSQSRECYRAPGAPSSPVADEMAGAAAGAVADAVAHAVAGAAAGATGTLLPEAAGYAHFCVVSVTITELEVLDLNHRSHTRRRWTRRGAGFERQELAR